MNIKPTSILDVLGISSASICLAHCLLFPMLTILPIGFIHNQWIDIAFACVGMFVVSKIILSKTSLKVKYVLGISVLFVITGVILEMFLGEDYWLVLIGGFGMIYGHILNFKLNHQ